MFSLLILIIFTFLSNAHFITSECNIIRNETSKNAIFQQIYDDVILFVTPLLSLSHVGLVECCQNCLSINRCISINININSKECDLLAADRNNETILHLFVSKKDWIYYDTGICKPVSGSSF